MKHIGEDMNWIDWIFISGNLLTFFVLLRADLGYKSLFIRLIMSLCIFDTLCIAFNISIFSGPLLDETYRLQVKSSQCWNDLKLMFNIIFQIFPCLVPIILPFAQISLTGSVFTILAVATERFLSIYR